MSTDLSNNRDFFAGLLFAGIGAGAFVLARDYGFGSSAQMGPGYVPAVLSGILVVLGIGLAAKGLRTRMAVTAPFSMRALITLMIAVILFAVIMPLAGFVPALAALVFVSATANGGLKIIEILLLDRKSTRLNSSH